MNPLIAQYARKLIPDVYVKQASQAKQSIDTNIRILIEKGQCPSEGWSDAAISHFLGELSLMDSNNFSHNAGVGEREARIFSDLVSKRHYNFGHGIGRSGDLTEVQPKAAGSSLMYKLTNSMILDIIKISGGRNTKAALVVPMATGLSISLCLQSIRKDRPQAEYVLWSRIDQKSSFKSITCAGYKAIVVENILVGDELRTDVSKMGELIEEFGCEKIAAIVTTTSCFAPRAIDVVEEVSKLCMTFHIAHIINNAYGMQSSKCMHHIEQASRCGRVDAVVQSTDKNLMVPVGGAIISGYNNKFIDQVSKTYPGRASSSPILDVFITLLSMGTIKYRQLLKERKQMKNYLSAQLQIVATKFHLKVLDTKNNPISMGLSLPAGFTTELGSMLFIRGVSGTRVITLNQTKVIEDQLFEGWGTHCGHYPVPYLTAAASIGMQQRDVDLFIKRLDKCLDATMKKCRIG